VSELPSYDLASPLNGKGRRIYGDSIPDSTAFNIVRLVSLHDIDIKSTTHILIKCFIGVQLQHGRHNNKNCLPLSAMDMSGRTDTMSEVVLAP
jgi:hypothetical protein